MIVSLAPRWPDLPRVRAFVLTRSGGVSAPPYASLNLAQHVDDDAAAVLANREAVAAWLPGEPRMQWLNQVHGTQVLDLTGEEPDTGAAMEADGLVTRVPGLACCVLTADCLPIFLVSEQSDEVALVHAGWRGLAGGIVERAIARMKTSPGQVRAWFGPAIAACHFEVGDEVRAAFLASNAGLADCFHEASAPGKYMANLYAIAEHKLLALGVSAVSGGEHCSYCDRDRFYSYRRDGRTGRNLSIIYLQSD